MPSKDSPSKLAEITGTARSAGLTIRLETPGDLSVIGCTAETKDKLGEMVTLAREAGLRVKWMNEGWLVAVGVPTKKTSLKDGQKVGEKPPESSP